MIMFMVILAIAILSSSLFQERMIESKIYIKPFSNLLVKVYD